MYAEFNEYSVLSMLNSEMSSLVKEQAEGIQLDISKRPSLEFDDCARDAASVIDSQDEGGAVEVESGTVISAGPIVHSLPNFTEDDREEEERDVAVSEESGSVGKLSLGQFDEVAFGEEDDGFKTPTSPGHKITVAKQCPPAPRKPKSSISSRKRKVSSPTARRRQQVVLDLTEEVESLFPKPDFNRKIKKVRKEEN